MRLAGLLGELHTLIPGRVRWVTFNVIQVLYAGSTRMAAFSAPDTWVWIEAALREECDIRGWDWAVYRSGRTYRAALYRNPGQDSTEVDDLESDEPSPVEALAAIVLDALRAEAAPCR